MNASWACLMKQFFLVDTGLKPNAKDRKKYLELNSTVILLSFALSVSTGLTLPGFLNTAPEGARYFL